METSVLLSSTFFFFFLQNIQHWDSYLPILKVNKIKCTARTLVREGLSRVERHVLRRTSAWRQSVTSGGGNLVPRLAGGSDSPRASFLRTRFDRPNRVESRSFFFFLHRSLPTLRAINPSARSAKVNALIKKSPRPLSKLLRVRVRFKSSLTFCLSSLLWRFRVFDDKQEGSVPYFFLNFKFNLNSMMRNLIIGFFEKNWTWNLPGLEKFFSTMRKEGGRDI